jgi:hypothetical protein
MLAEQLVCTRKDWEISFLMTFFSYASRFVCLFVCFFSDLQLSLELSKNMD